MDRARFRAEFETLCDRTEGLLRAAASGSQAAAEVAVDTFEALHASIEEMRVVDEELVRLDRELVDAYRRADLERRRYRDLFMTTAEADVLTDARGTIAEANHAAGQLFGASPDDLVGKPLGLLVARRDRTRFHSLVRLVRGGAAPVGPSGPLLCQTLRRDRRFRCEIGVERIEGAEPGEPVFRFSLRDQSDRERAAERDVLVAQAARKDEFLAALGHELRNPLAALSLASDLVRRDLDAGQLDSARRSLDVIARHAQQLGRLVDDLLDAARVRHGKIDLHLRPVELSEVVGHAIETVQPVVQEKRQSIEIHRQSGPLWVPGDAARLQQVVANLLHNAAKYSPDDSRIQVFLRARDAVAVLAVRDEGAGIPAHMLESIFGLFEQAEVGGSSSGLGLGLSLVRELVHLHGGEVRAASEGPGRGSEFVVSLPLLPVAGLQPEESGRMLATGDPVSVLVADDNADAAEILALTLRQLGHDVAIATSGAEAIERAAQRPFTAALLDLAMPDLDGFAVAARLRAVRPELRLIAVTGFGDERNRQRASAAGFEHYFVKPLDLASLDALLRRRGR